MSEVVHYRGILKKVAEGEKESEEYAKKYYKDSNKNIESYCDTALESLTQEGYGEEYLYFYEKDELYKFININEVDAYSDIVEGRQIGNGLFEFEVKYYNGGAGLEEVINEALSNAEKEKSHNNTLTTRPMQNIDTLCDYTKSGNTIKEGDILGYGDNYYCVVLYDTYSASFKAVEFGYKSEGYLCRVHDLYSYTTKWEIVGDIDNKKFKHEFLKGMPNDFDLTEYLYE